MTDVATSSEGIGRRDALKLLGTATVAGASVPVFGGTVAATDSGDAEIELQGAVPGETSFDATVEEYDTEGSSSPINDPTVTITDAGVREPLPELDAQGSYYYLFDITFNGGDDTPELEAIVLEIPRDPAEYADTDYTGVLDWEAKPDTVSIEYDEYALRRYQPILSMDPETLEGFNGLYGYVARSEDHDTDVMCYWSQLSQGRDLPVATTSTSLGHSAPIYVFVDSDSGEVNEVVYASYHWFATSLDFQNDQDLLTSNWTDSPTHSQFTIADPWNHYRFTPNAGGTLSSIELKPWPEVRSAWVGNGFYGPAEVAAIEDPWSMRDRGFWWESGSLNSYVAGALADIDGIVGLWGADNSDYHG